MSWSWDDINQEEPPPPPARPHDLLDFPSQEPEIPLLL